jgi:CRP/FNR family transcriptional regulator, nitrogen fixation regulation protein
MRPCRFAGLAEASRAGRRVFDFDQTGKSAPWYIKPLGVLMFTNLNTDPSKRPRLLGELGALSHMMVSSGEFKYNKRTEIFGEAEPADYIYQVIEDAVRSYKLLSDGRRQIGAFHLAGDSFGLENGDFHRFTAEAIVDTTVRLMKRQSLERVAKTDPAIIRKIRSMTTDNLQHAENHMLSLGTQDLAGTRCGIST